MRRMWDRVRPRSGAGWFSWLGMLGLAAFTIYLITSGQAVVPITPGLAIGLVLLVIGGGIATYAGIRLIDAVLR